MFQVTGDFVELKPNPDLLNLKFDSYKISFDKYLQRRLRLSCAALFRQAGSSQFGFEHLKLFNDINYLYSDPFSSNGRWNTFYVFLDDNCLHSFTFDGNNFHESVIEANIRCSVSDNSEISERYPPTLSFASEEYIFTSNGCGILSMFSTGQRDANVIWKEVMSCAIQFSGREVGPFVIIESRCFNQYRIEVLLRSIVSHENCPEEKAGHMFWNRLHWVSIKNDNGQWHIANIREILCKGHFEFATIDYSGDDIILAGNEDYCFSLANQSKKLDITEDLKDVIHEIGGKKNYDGCEGSDATYIWAQTREDVTVYFKLPEKIEKRDIDLMISSSNIQLTYKKSDLLNGIFGGIVDSSLSTYIVDGNRLELTLVKAKLCSWKSVVIGDTHGVQESSKEALDLAYSHLEMLKSGIPGLETPGGNRIYNTDLLEECDMSGEELSKVLWISGNSYGVKHTADISGNAVLFTCQSPNKPRMFCIRMDVDGILWSFNSDEKRPIIHTATFDAFGYVEASKTEKKFVTCSNDFKYVAIIEMNGRAYLYWQSLSKKDNAASTPLPMNTSKQCLITLQRQDFNCDDDDEFDENNIIGVYAGQYAFYLLTTGHLFSFVFNSKMHLFICGRMALKFIDNQFQFAEMNIRYTGNMDRLLTLLRRAIRMGYDSIVINTDIGDPDKNVDSILETESEPPRKKKKGRYVNRENAIPDPIKVDESNLDVSELENNGKKLRLFSRLTVDVSDTTSVHMLMHHPQVRKYDLLAIRVNEEQTLQTLSRKGDFVDIITYNQESTSVPWLFKSKIINSCTSAGISFEISYASALKDASQRRQILANGRQLMIATRGGKGVILDSGAEEMIDLRGPFDTVNIAILFGVRHEDARKLIAGNAKAALYRAESRKTLKGALHVTTLDQVPSRSLSHKCALQRLMRVPEFKAQIELIDTEEEESKT